MLLVSLELEEILSLSDRILVLYEGKIVAEFPPDVTEEEVGIAMPGAGNASGRLDRGPEQTPAPAPLGQEPEAYAPTVARRLAFYQRAGGIVTPLLTAVFAFLMGGIVVAATGHNPLTTYKAIFEGAGLNWFFHFGNYHIDVPFTNAHVWFWWDTNTNHTAAYNLTQTLLTTTPLILTGLAVAFAFRCGLFNIGGQGQYIVGAITAVWSARASSTWRTSRTSCSRSLSRRWPARRGVGSPASSRRRWARTR